MTNHLKKDCRASQEKKDKWKAQQKQKGLKELSEDVEGELDGLGSLTLCRLALNELSDAQKRERIDDSDRTITFAVDTAACCTVIPSRHPAARGYTTHSDKKKGLKYGTAKKGAERVLDEGLRVLQTKVTSPAEAPHILKTRKADVQAPLMAGCEMVDAGHILVFDSGGSYAVNKKTGRVTQFKRKPKGWELTLDIAAPDQANKDREKFLKNQSCGGDSNFKPTLSPIQLLQH